MTDYFAALTRSAGLARERREPMRDPAGIVEQNVERVADSRGVAYASSPLPHAEPATIAAETSEHDNGPVAQPAVPAKRGIPASTAPPRSVSADPPEALVRNAAVGAALRWVAADPARRHDPSTPSIIDEAPRRSASPAITQQVGAAPPASKDSDSLDTKPAWIEIQAAPTTQRDAAQRPERARTLTTNATVVDRLADEIPPLQEERVEVSIGTIHVRVDAPSPPAVVAQPRQASQPSPERHEERSSFSRSRIPRI
jgi:hypothetical protein